MYEDIAKVRRHIWDRNPDPLVNRLVEEEIAKGPERARWMDEMCQEIFELAVTKTIRLSGTSSRDELVELLNARDPDITGHLFGTLMRPIMDHLKDELGSLKGVYHCDNVVNGAERPACGVTLIVHVGERRIENICFLWAMNERISRYCRDLAPSSFPKEFRLMDYYIMTDEDLGREVCDTGILFSLENPDLALMCIGRARYKKGGKGGA